MRRIVALTLLSFAAASPAPLAAQFEGTVTMKMSAAGAGAAGDMTMKVAIKNGMSATVMSMPSGPMAGMEMRSINDGKTVTSLIPMPPGMAAQMPGMANAKGMKMVVDLTKMPSGTSGTPEKVDVKKLGTTETIIGISCDDYEITSASGTTTRACMATGLGRFIMPQSGGGMGRRGGGQSAPSWATAFGNQPVFPLKVWTTDGKVAMEVTAIDKSPVPASMFEIPDGYIDMAAMMGGMRPPM